MGNRNNHLYLNGYDGSRLEQVGLERRNSLDYSRKPKHSGFYRLAYNETLPYRGRRRRPKHPIPAL